MNAIMNIIKVYTKSIEEGWGGVGVIFVREHIS